MDKIAIALQGKSETGKTTVIMDVFDKLQKGNKVTYYNWNGQQTRTRPSKREVHAIIITKRRKIGITSYGDVPDHLKIMIDMFKAEKCDIIICATRTKLGTVKVVKGLSPDYSIIFLGQIFCKDETDGEVKNYIAPANDKTVQLITSIVADYL